MTVRILIVDEDNNLISLIKNIIRKKFDGYKIITASNPEEAFSLLNRMKFQIVLTGIIMKGMTVLELIEQIKKKNHDTCVIIMGSYEEVFYKEALEKGADDFVVNPSEEFLIRIQRVLRDRKEKERYRTEAITDELTGLYNLRYFRSRLKSEIECACSAVHPLSLIIFDIDNFKTYNNMYLQSGGNNILMQVSHAVRSCLRKTDCAFRYGGDEFAAILSDTTRLESFVIVRRIRNRIKKYPFSPENGKKCRVTLSIGVAEYYPNEESSEFVKRAEQSLVNAKQNGKDAVCSDGEIIMAGGMKAMRSDKK